MILRLLALLVAALLPARAGAGAWAREAGEVYLSFGGNVALFSAERPVHYDPTIYLEFGALPRLTFGLNAYLADAGTAGSGFVWARLALDDGTGPDRWAVGGGIGATILPDGTYEPSARADLHWGRGLDRGWLAVDVEGVWAIGSDRRQIKAEGVWGQRFAEGWTSLLSAQAGTGLTGDFYAKVAGALSYAPAERWDLSVGIDHALTGDRGSGLLMRTSFRF
ncbi:hypothetical protein [Wenxinia saemankumensis]|uniref:Cellulose biosynthesis protein BcsS n=1 Tax=Wenxinia saemankumensis TaxID=1447782 RepID=A0A1M6HR68_9RHOB|nr:hypothetical protein [Wenxinia saemankumensis]SHJ24681.1 hypothetical protein SAMN05444417_3308 [Wenxinia saemankumensis]